MNRDEIEPYQTKYIKIFLKNRSVFHGRIKQLSDESLLLTDKYDKLVSVSLDQISYITELEEKQ